MKETLPQGIELTALDESFRDDPYKILGRLRDIAPVYEYAAVPGFRGLSSFWVVNAQ